MDKRILRGKPKQDNKMNTKICDSRNIPKLKICETA